MAFSDLFDRGQIIIPRGGIAYLVQGTKVPVDLRATSSCTAELPITAYLNNETQDLFCDVFSYTIRRVPTNISCDHLMKPEYDFHGIVVYFT